MHNFSRGPALFQGLSMSLAELSAAAETLISAMSLTSRQRGCGHRVLVQYWKWLQQRRRCTSPGGQVPLHSCTATGLAAALIAAASSFAPKQLLLAALIT